MRQAPPQSVFHSLPFPHWRQQTSRLQVRFIGRLADVKAPPRREVLEQLEAAPSRLSWLKQTHSATVRTAANGACGDGDGLWTEEPDLALSIVTADCVPIVCGSDRVVSAIHAGWRGLVAGVIGATVADLPAPASDLEAWLGPAIGPCCYEVSDDVAELVANSSSASIVVQRGAERPHLDLHGAAEWQLRKLGVQRVHRIDSCTRCNSDVLWSYRGEGGSNGRNLTFAWLTR